MKLLSRGSTARAELARDDVLVEPAWLEEHLHDRELRLIDIDVSSAAYEDGHIPGALLWNVYRDLKDSDYRLVDKAAVQRLVTEAGITPTSTIVFYGYAPAMGFWLMKRYGHDRVRILDCAREAWRKEHRPWTKVVATPAVSNYPLPDEDGAIRADQQAVRQAIDNPDCALIDVRTESEYRGERFWPSGGLEPGGRAGHIPSARRVSMDAWHDERGALKDVNDLRQTLAGVEMPGQGDVITYCTIGGRACTAWFVLTYLLGHEHVRVYDGSWAEWGRLPAAPVECS